MGERGLRPIEGRRATLLVLGSMPGAASLAARRYYAHPRNAFWRIFGAEGTYGARCRRLRASGIALWDVLASCDRKGSLDTAIRKPRPNRLSAFHRRHPELRTILFNGRKARELFDRLVGRLPGVRLKTLPSTSPANTDVSKLLAWRRALRGILRAHATPAAPPRAPARRARGAGRVPGAPPLRRRDGRVRR